MHETPDVPGIPNCLPQRRSCQKISGPAWPHGQSRASFKATTGLLSCLGLWDSHCDSGAAFDGGGGATSLSQRCSDKPLQPWADKGLKGEELHTVQTLLFLIRYSDTQLTANLL